MSPIVRIDDKRWAVKVSGDIIDLAEAADLFGHGHQTIRDDVLPTKEEVALQADEFERLEHATEVHDAAERILVALNAVLYLEDPARRPLTISSVHQRGSDGNWSIAIFPKSASFRLRGGKIHGHTGSSVAPTPQSTWVDMGLTEEAIGGALSYLRGTPDWIALYQAYEAMDKDVSELESRIGPILGWPSRQQIRAFTRSAQLHRHSKSWCEKHRITSSGAMKFDDAATLVRSMAKIWIEWRRENSFTERSF